MRVLLLSRCRNNVCSSIEIRMLSHSLDDLQYAVSKIPQQQQKQQQCSSSSSSSNSSNSSKNPHNNNINNKSKTSKSSLIKMSEQVDLAICQPATRNAQRQQQLQPAKHAARASPDRPDPVPVSFFLSTFSTFKMHFWHIRIMKIS